MSLNFGNGLLASGGFEEFWNDLLNEAGNGNKTLGLAILIVGAVIVLVALVSLTVSIVLGVKYYRFNRKENNAGLTGVEAARKILDAKICSISRSRRSARSSSATVTAITSRKCVSAE